MASEYLKQKYKDVPPDSPVEYTKQQKCANWLHYHKWHIVICAVLLLAGMDIGKNILGIGEVKPDYQIAYVGTSALPEDAVTAIETAFASLGEDCNGDGKVEVRVNQYAAYTSTDHAEDSLKRALQNELADGSANTDSNNTDSAYYAEAARVSLMADLESCDSFFFLLEDYETFHEDYAILSHTDGSLPDKWDSDDENLAYAWTNCPVLSSLDLGKYTETIAGTEVSGDTQELLSGLSLARRGFWTEETCENLDGCEKLWDRLTTGVTK